MFAWQGPASVGAVATRIAGTRPLCLKSSLGKRARPRSGASPLAPETLRSTLEQLAICLAQEGASDEGTEKILGFRSSDAAKQDVASHLVQRFIDPAHPASYPALKRKLRRDVAGPEHPRKIDSVPSDWEGIDEKALTEEDRKKIRPRVTQTQHDYSVRRAAEIVSIPCRTLYLRIQAGKVSVQHDRWGRIRVSADELEKLRDKEKDQKIERDLAQFLSDRHRITPTSARKRIYRALKNGKTIEEIFKDSAENRREQ